MTKPTSSEGPRHLKIPRFNSKGSHIIVMSFLDVSGTAAGGRLGVK